MQLPHKLVNVTKRLPLTTDVVLRMLAEDPLLFTIQFFRKLPSGPRFRAAGLIPKDIAPAGLRAFRALLLDHRMEAVEILEQASAQAPAQSPLGRLESELLIQLGRPSTHQTDPRTAARALWAQGEVSAIDPHELGGKLAQRFAGEQTLLNPGTGIRLPLTPIERCGQENSTSVQAPRVLFILTNSLPWTKSGYTYRTHSILKAVQDTGAKVLGVTRLGYPTTIGALNAGERDILDGVRYERILPHRWPSNPARRLVVQAKEIVRIAQDFQPDIIHTTTNYQNALVAEAVSHATDIPWVYEMRGNMEQTWVARQPEDLQEARSQSEYYRLMRGRETELAGRADAVITLSNVQKHDLAERGVSTEKVTVIPNSVDVAVLDVTRNQEKARMELGLDTGAFWVGTVTSVVDYEGLPTLLQAVRLLRDRGHDVRCAIVGGGVALPDLKVLVRELELEREGAAVFPGQVPKSDASRWYQALDIFTIPRVDTIVTRNVAPLKGLEAMALGIPVITSDLPVLAESIAGLNLPNFEAGNADDLARQIQELMQNERKFAAASKAAKQEAQQRTWQRAADALHELYGALVHAKWKP